MDRDPLPPFNTPEDAGEGMRVWRERFHTAAYMTLLMGAVFARAYQAPFYSDGVSGEGGAGVMPSPPLGDAHGEEDESSGPGASLDVEAEARRKELWDLLRQASSDRSNNMKRHLRLMVNESTREYLRQFPVYDLNDELGGQEKVFGPFIEWFIRVIIAQYHNVTPKPATRDPSRPAIQKEIERLEADEYADHSADVLTGGDWVEWPDDGRTLSELFDPSKFAGSPAEAEAVVWAAMQAVHMFEFILTCVTNLDGSCRFGRRCCCTCCCDDGGGTVPGSTSTSTPLDLWITPTKAVTAKVVLFGVFQAEEIVMQADVESSIDQQLVAHFPTARCVSASASSPTSFPHPHDEWRGFDINDKEYLDIPLVLEDLYSRSGIANVNTLDNPLGPRSSGYARPPPPLQLFMFLLEKYFNLEFGYGLFEGMFRDSEQSYWLFKKRATIFAHGPELVPERNVLDYTNGMEFLVPLYTRTLAFKDRGVTYCNDRLYHGNPRTWEPDYDHFEMQRALDEGWSLSGPWLPR